MTADTTGSGGSRIDGMTTISIEELGKRAAELLDHDEPVFVMRDGEEVAVLYPLREPKTPMEERRKRFIELSRKIGEQMGPDVTEEEIARGLAEHQARRRGR